MKNKEKFAEEIADIFINGDRRVAINKRTGEPVACYGYDCGSCLFGRLLDNDCKSHLKEWAESEYKEPITAERLAREFSKYHGSVRLGYILSFANWVLNRYTLTEKEEEE